jgi:hypothetical protein
MSDRNPRTDGRSEDGPTVDRVIARMDEMAARLAPDDARRHFHAVYLRTTRAVGEELDGGGFLDPEWLSRWDAVFATLYTDAFDAWGRGEAPRAWAVPFSAAEDRPDLPPLRHILFGMNVHINFDLPQALIAVITDDEFDDPEILARRERDHVRIDTVLARRVAAEDRELTGKSLTDRMLTPLNRRATKRFLTEARNKVWRNARVLSAARRAGADRLAARIDQLDVLCAARVADLVAPGRVILKLARRGFGVLLPDA